MIVGQLKTLIAAYLHRDIADFVKGTGGNQVDILLVALNHARKKAEKVVDFSVCRQKGYLKILTDDVDWSTGTTWFDGGDWVGRRVKRFGLRTTGTAADGEFGGVDRFLRSISRDQQAELFTRQDYRWSPSYPGARYPGDAILDPLYNPLLNQPYAVVRGTTVGLYPVPTTSQMMIVDAFVWFPDWTADDDDDWFTQNCSEYLMYEGICEANKLLMKFVGGNDTTLPPPTKEADAALQALVITEMETQEGSIQIADL